LINDRQSDTGVVSSANSYRHLVNNVLSVNNLLHDLPLYVNVNDPLFVNAFVHIVTCCSSVANVNYVLNSSLHAGVLTTDVDELVVHILYNVDINY